MNVVLGVGRGKETERPYAGKNAKCPNTFDWDCSLFSGHKALSKT